MTDGCSAADPEGAPDHKKRWSGVQGSIAATKPSGLSLQRSAVSGPPGIVVHRKEIRIK